MTFEHYEFAKLIHPVTPEEFFRDYWEQKPLVVHREDPGYYRDLLDIERVNKTITSLEHHHDAIFMGNQENKVEPEDYTYDTGMIDVARLYAQFADGSSIALNNMQDRVDTLSNLTRSMEAELSIRFQTNIYFTPPNAQCFPPHYDSHCVFALQCEGQKKWRLYDFPVQLPYHTQKFELGKVPIGPVSQEFVLESGDFVYCPRGLGHDADTQGIDEPSLHITLGVLQHTWANLLVEAVAQVSMNDATLRKALPIGFAKPGFDRTEARRVYEEMREYLFERMDFDTAMDFFVDDVVATRHPVLPDQFQQIMRLKDVQSTDRRAGRRPNLLYKLEHGQNGESGRVSVSAYGSEITLPDHAAEPLKFALENDDFAIADLPGELDDAGKLVLIKRLVREGLVMIKDEA